MRVGEKLSSNSWEEQLIKLVGALTCDVERKRFQLFFHRIILVKLSLNLITYNMLTKDKTNKR